MIAPSRKIVLRTYLLWVRLAERGEYPVIVSAEGCGMVGNKYAITPAIQDELIKAGWLDATNNRITPAGYDALYGEISHAV